MKKGVKIKSDQLSFYNLLLKPHCCNLLVLASKTFYVCDIADQHSVELHPPEVPHFAGNSWSKLRLQ